jgi:hypothetical protein
VVRIVGLELAVRMRPLSIITMVRRGTIVSCVASYLCLQIVMQVDLHGCLLATISTSTVVGADGPVKFHGGRNLSLTCASQLYGRESCEHAVLLPHSLLPQSRRNNAASFVSTKQ